MKSINGRIKKVNLGQQPTEIIVTLPVILFTDGPHRVSTIKTEGLKTVYITKDNIKAGRGRQTLIPGFLT